jgi:hypothetical protein
MNPDVQSPTQRVRARRVPWPAPMPMRLLRLALALGVGGSLACDGTLADPRYPPREAACAVHFYAERPAVPIDELGTMGVLCANCDVQLRAAVCRRGGDVAWGLRIGYQRRAGAAVLASPQIAIGHTRTAPVESPMVPPPRPAQAPAPPPSPDSPSPSDGSVGAQGGEVSL